MIDLFTRLGTAVGSAAATAFAAEVARKSIELMPVWNRKGARARRVLSIEDSCLKELQEIYYNDDPRLPRNELIDWQLLLSTIEPSLMQERVFGSWRHQTVLIVGERRYKGNYTPRGLLYFHTSWTRGMAFGSLLKTDKKSVIRSDPELCTPTPLTRLMFRKMRQYLRGPLWIRPISRIFFEVENPRQMQTRKQQRGAEARLRRFCDVARPKKYLISQIDWNYLQPFPDISVLKQSAPGSELQMHLMVAAKRDQERISARNLKEVIQFIYCCVYASVANGRHPSDHLYLGYLGQLAKQECDRIDRSGCKSFRLLPLM